MKNCIGTVTSCGNSTINMRITASARRNGHTAFTIRSIFIFPALQATFSTVPTGGVRSPITVIKINTTPKYATSIPAAFTAGRSTGVRIIIVGVTSIEVPTKITRQDSELAQMLMTRHLTRHRTEKEKLLERYPDYFVV